MEGARGCGRRRVGGRLFWCSVYLLYWYKSTNTDAEGAPQRASSLLWAAERLEHGEGLSGGWWLLLPPSLQRLCLYLCI